ncbi:MAG: hypothetical protein ACHP8A_15865, partial [Terriglobales bacterium]
MHFPRHSLKPTSIWGSPATTKTVGGVECRTAFLNEAGSGGKNSIPAGRITTIGANILSFYPTPQNGNLNNNFLFPFSFPILDTTTTFRIDQNITQ